MTEPIDPQPPVPEARPTFALETPPPTPPKRRRQSAFAEGVPAWALFAAAAVLLALFVAFVVFLLVEASRRHVAETQWTRMYLVFGTAEAIAFTVVGWLFGRQVSKTALRSAKEQLTSARHHETTARKREQRAQQNAAEAHDQARRAREESHRHQLAAEQLKERARAFLVMAPQGGAGTERLAGTRKAAPNSEPVQSADDLVNRAATLFDLDRL